MGKLIKFETSEIPEVLVIGKEFRYNMEELMKGNNPLGGYWGACMKDEIFKVLESQPEHVYDKAYVGVMTDWDKGDGDFSYIIGMLMKPSANVPDGYHSKKLDATKVAVAWVQGKDTEDVCGDAHELTEKALKEKGCVCEKMSWSMELYNCPRFTDPDENGEIILDYYIPIN